MLRFTADQAAGLGFHRRRATSRCSLRAKPPARCPKAPCCPTAEGGGDPALRGRSRHANWPPSSPGPPGSPSPSRPDAEHSYTNNWPYDKAAGNTATAGSMMWSAVSVATLLMFLALILFVQHRYRLAREDASNARLNFDVRQPCRSRPRSAPRPSTSWSRCCCSWSRPCWAARWPTITWTAPASSASTSRRTCPSTSPAPGTCSWPSSGSPPPGSAWASSSPRW